MRLREYKFKGIFTDGKRLFTKSIAPRKKHFDERILRDGKDEFRQWEPRKSKLAAAMMRGVKEIGVAPGMTVLYLGASHGYTPSFMSDLIGEHGFMFALDFAPRVVRDLVFVSEHRKNIAPIMADANHPELYFHEVTDVDYVYQDIAQKNQAEIFLKNIKMFLKQEGLAFLAVKSRSIDISKKPRIVFEEVRKLLEKEVEILDYRDIEPFEKDHCVFVCRKR
ncbi:MAG: fibrillarin-like rRNA/tRNA 2'-O-methyltransferase [Nanoarchaeota archaeon]|nr:fibrillarin-like rRNA/tRNA 2'-O-methyltransferase [Nanoarchaeota archaeon]